MPNRVLTLTKIKRNPITFLALGNSLSYQDKSGTGTLSASGALRYQPGSGGRVNLVGNPSAEVDASGWSNRVGGTFTRITTDSSQGSACIEINGPSNGAGGSFGTPSTLGKIRTNNKHVLSFDAKAVSGATDWRIEIVELRADGTSLSTLTYSVAITSAWARYAVAHTPVSAGVHYLGFRPLRDSASAGVARFDGFVLEELASASPVPTYFDGASAGCAWADPITGVAGTAHASPSISKAAFWIEEGTTNYISNPSTEINGTSSISPTGTPAGVTNTQDSTYALFGSSALKTVFDGSISNQYVYRAGSLSGTGVARTFIGSIYVRGSSTGAIKMTMQVNYTDASSTSSASIGFTDVPLSDTWQRVVTPAITCDPAKTLASCFIHLSTANVTQTATFWSDGAQIEEKTYATSYCDGSLGAGYTWAGTAHASASTRANTNVTLSNAINVTLISPINGSVATVSKRFYDRNSSSQPMFTLGQYGTQDWVQINNNSGTDQVGSGWRSGAPTSTSANLPGTVAAGTPVFVYGGWEGTSLYAGGSTGATVVAPRPSPTGAFNNTMWIGSDGGNYLDGSIGPVAIFDRPLTDAERLTLAATDPTLWWNALA